MFQIADKINKIKNNIYFAVFRRIGTSHKPIYNISCFLYCLSFERFQSFKAKFFRDLSDGIQYHHHRLPALLVLLLLPAHQCFSSGRHRHPDPGVCSGLPREPVCGLVSALPGEEALSDLFVGAESGSGGRFRAAQRPVFPALPGWRPGLGVWLGCMQAGALPVRCQHVWVHLPHLPDEHGPLAGCNQAFYVPENENQTLPAGSPAGSLGVSVHPGRAGAFLPQVRRKCFFVPLILLHFFNLQS